MLLPHCIRRAASRAACTAGNNKPTKIPMIAMTTNNSTNVKPWRFEVCLHFMALDPSEEKNKKKYVSDPSPRNHLASIRLNNIVLFIPKPVLRENNSHKECTSWHCVASTNTGGCQVWFSGFFPTYLLGGLRFGKRSASYWLTRGSFPVSANFFLFPPNGTNYHANATVLPSPQPGFPPTKNVDSIYTRPYSNQTFHPSPRNPLR